MAGLIGEARLGRQTVQWNEDFLCLPSIWPEKLRIDLALACTNNVGAGV